MAPRPESQARLKFVSASVVSTMSLVSMNSSLFCSTRRSAPSACHAAMAICMYASAGRKGRAGGRGGSARARAREAKANVLRVRVFGACHHTRGVSQEGKKATMPSGTVAQTCVSSAA